MRLLGAIPHSKQELLRMVGFWHRTSCLNDWLQQTELCMYTWNPNVPCFDWKRPCFGGKTKDKWVPGYIYITMYIYIHVCINIFICPHASASSFRYVLNVPTFESKQRFFFLTRTNREPLVSCLIYVMDYIILLSSTPLLMCAWTSAPAGWKTKN